MRGQFGVGSTVCGNPTVREGAAIARFLESNHFGTLRILRYGRVSANVTKARFSIDESMLFAVSVQEFLEEALVGKRRKIVFGSEFEENWH